MRCVFVLKLCSGHRRPGDFVDLASCLDLPGNFKVWVICIDIVSGNSEHNLADDVCFNNTLAHLNAKRIHGWVIGPPCETWTAVRFIELEGGTGPRPLRSAVSPWALPNLSVREYAQLTIGNTLLRAAITLSIESLGCGLSGVVEHPDEPSDSAYPSIWRLEVMQRISTHPDASIVSFRQGPLGQISPKPTRFLTANLPRVKEYIDSFSSSHFKPVPVALRTVEADGLFATAKLKTYPARLNDSVLMFSIDRFAKCSSRRSDAESILNGVFATLYDRCIEVANLAHLGIAFSDYSHTPFESDDHALSSLASWPDRDAGIGKDLRFSPPLFLPLFMAVRIL